MSPTGVGMTVGAVLSLTWIIFGFWAFLFVAVSIAIGALIGRVVSGKLDLRSLLSAFQGKRTSS